VRFAPRFFSRLGCKICLCFHASQVSVQLRVAKIAVQSLVSSVCNCSYRRSLLFFSVLLCLALSCW
jgi:hypothetical protein